MNSIVYLFSIGGLSIIVGAAPHLNLFNTDIVPFLADGGSNIISTPRKSLVLINGGKISETKDSIVWKGRFNEKIDVALKIASYMYPWSKETQALEALNAMKDPNIEKHDIPRVYYHGTIFNQYFAIARTLFDGSLNDLYERHKGNISESQILLIFKQAVQALEYVHGKNVIHNDIKPQTLYIRGTEVFIGDFDTAAFIGNRSLGYTKEFASTGYYECRDRYPMDDLESLIFSMWYIAGIPLGISNEFVQEAEGRILMNEKKAGRAIERVLGKCNYFKNPIVRKAFEAICADEMLSNKRVPNYELIIKILDKAMIEVRNGSEPVRFHWLTEIPGSEYSHFQTGSNRMKCK